MTKRKYRVFGFDSEIMLNKGRPDFGAIVTASTPEDAVELVIKNKRGAKNLSYFGVCAFSNYVEIAQGYGGEVKLL